MNTLYLQCNMGAAGDMLMAALLELHPDPESFIKKMNELGIPGVVVRQENSAKCGIHGTHMVVTVDGVEEESLDEHSHLHDHEHAHEHHHNHDHEHMHAHEHTHNHDNIHHHAHEHEHDHHHAHIHTGMHEIEHLIDSLSLPEKVKEDALEVYRLIAEAESHAHNQSVEQIHFHEVGTKDAVADVVGVCLLMHELGVDKIIASPVHVGSGHVQCAHGILPVPAPATAYILQDVPVYSGEIKGELCTPTGAALLKHFVTEFGSMPVMKLKKTGYGMGKKDFPVANCVRAMLGEQEEEMDSVIELSCNLDDMTPEAIGFATETLTKAGALDVYTIAVQMKKNRPGILLTCMCPKKEKEKFLQLIFKHTTTLGVREYTCCRYGLERENVERETSLGIVHKKRSSGYGVVREKLEYDDIATIAREKDMSLESIKEKIEEEWGK